MRIAVMQPYFLPYAGYFRLMHGVDAFVVYDTVQFPRGGWVHRNRLHGHDGKLAWLTLPLAYAPLHTRIGDIGFHGNGDERWRERIRAFPACRATQGDAALLAEEIAELPPSPIDLLLGTLRTATRILGFDTPFVLASDLALPMDSDRRGNLLAICRALGATKYVNAPGGRVLYDPESFARHGIALQFLPEYRGNATSILQRLSDEAPAAVRREIDGNLT